MNRDPLLSKLTAVAEDTAYPVDAYLFVLRGMEFAKTNVPQDRWQERGEQIHLDATDVCWSLIDYASSQAWENPRSQLASWNIRDSADFGAIVYALMDAKLALASESDHRSDFAGIFTLEVAFASSHDEVTIDNDTSPLPERTSKDFTPPQFSLRHLFLVAIVVGIVVLVAKREYRYQKTLEVLSTYETYAIDAQGKYVKLAEYGGQLRALAVLGVVDARAVNALSRLPKLEALLLNQVDETGLAGDVTFPNVREVTIHRMSHEALDNVVRCFPNAEQLTVSSLFGPASVSALPKLSRLKQLSLFCPLALVSELQALQHCPELEDLSLTYTSVSGEVIGDLSGCPKLTRLAISHASLDEASIDSILALPTLRRLKLFNTHIDKQQGDRLRAWEQLDELIVEEQPPS